MRVVRFLYSCYLWSRCIAGMTSRSGLGLDAYRDVPEISYWMTEDGLTGNSERAYWMGLILPDCDMPVRTKKEGPLSRPLSFQSKASD